MKVDKLDKQQTFKSLDVAVLYKNQILSIYPTAEVHIHRKFDYEPDQFLGTKREGINGEKNIVDWVLKPDAVKKHKGYYVSYTVDGIRPKYKRSITDIDY